MKKSSTNDRLSLRLRMIADLVSAGSRLADVGCDHGYLSIELVASGRCPSAVAMDVRSGPLSRATEHVLEAGLTEKICTRLGDGLKKLCPGEADSVVIAGMGGPLMEQIISDSIGLCHTMKELILQPQSDIPHFRRFLFENGFPIRDERMVKDAGKYYIAVKAVPLSREMAEEKSVPWNETELLCGKVLLGRKDPVLKEYLIREKRLNEQILDRLQGTDTENAAIRDAGVRKILGMIGEGLAVYESF